jgi:hypothetical protein
MYQYIYTVSKYGFDIIEKKNQTQKNLPYNGFFLTLEIASFPFVMRTIKQNTNSKYSKTI